MSSNKILETLSINSDVSLKIEEENYKVSSAQFSLTLKQISPGIGAAISALFEGGKTQEQLSDIVAHQDSWTEVFRFSYFLDHFLQRGIVCRTIQSDKHLLATVVPISLQPKEAKQTIQDDKKYILSRFALLRNEGGHLLLESPLARVKVLLHCQQASAIVTKLIKPRQAEELENIVEGADSATLKALLNILLNANFILKTDEQGNSQETENRALRGWEFHDLLFHSRTRQGRHNSGYGGTFRFLKAFPCLPSLKPPMSDKLIALETPDLAAIEAKDLPFTTVFEKRKSLPTQGQHPISKEQLGEFLYRVARVRQVIQMDWGEVTNRPYPSGGAIYELEIYPVIGRCLGLESGIYHYRPDAHELCQIQSEIEPVEQLLELARGSTMQDNPSQVLIVLTARFGRISWKYESIAYSLVLKHVGVLYQSMYLVATAMGLAPCAIGGGNSDLFAQAAGLDYLTESSVGEFILGTLAE